MVYIRRTQFLDCRDALVSIQGDHLPEMIFTSSYFHSYLKLVVEDIPLSPKLKFGLSYKGSTFVLKVEYKRHFFAYATVEVLRVCYITIDYMPNSYE